MIEESCLVRTLTAKTGYPAGTMVLPSACTAADRPARLRFGMKTGTHADVVTFLTYDVTPAGSTADPSPAGQRSSGYTEPI